MSHPFFYCSEQDSGIYEAMNKGIKKASGEWLYFMGADDVLSDEFVLERVFTSDLNKKKLVFGAIQYPNKRKFIAEFSKKMWFKNTLHHQAVFYKATLFQERTYDTSFGILADYELNLYLLKKQTSYKQLDVDIALCGNKGVSKQYTWKLYQEEIRLKTKHSSKLLYLFFYFLGLSKYCYRKFFS